MGATPPARGAPGTRRSSTLPPWTSAKAATPRGPSWRCPTRRSTTRCLCPACLPRQPQCVVRCHLSSGAGQLADNARPRRRGTIMHPLAHPSLHACGVDDGSTARGTSITLRLLRQCQLACRTRCLSCPLRRRWLSRRGRSCGGAAAMAAQLRRCRCVCGVIRLDPSSALRHSVQHLYQGSHAAS